MLLEILLQPRADDIDSATDIENSYLWDLEAPVSVSWVNDEDFGP